jgi:hypothetical protein
MFLFIGRDCHPQVLQEAFQVGEISAVPAMIPQLQTPRNEQLRAAIEYIRSRRPRFMHLTIVKQGFDPHHELRINNLMVEDSAPESPSYVDYLVTIHRYI